MSGRMFSALCKYVCARWLLSSVLVHVYGISVSQWRQGYKLGPLVLVRRLISLEEQGHSYSYIACNIPE